MAVEQARIQAELERERLQLKDRRKQKKMELEEQRLAADRAAAERQQQMLAMMLQQVSQMGQLMLQCYGQPKPASQVLPPPGSPPPLPTACDDVHVVTSDAGGIMMETVQETPVDSEAPVAVVATQAATETVAPGPPASPQRGNQRTKGTTPLVVVDPPPAPATAKRRRLPRTSSGPGQPPSKRQSGRARRAVARLDA